MNAAHILLTSFIWLITVAKAENPSYDQGFYKPEFLNYCYEEKPECEKVCGCILDKKCMVRPVPPAVMQVILDKHNSIRKERLKTEPKASGMPRLEYDAQLEAIAQCWAAKCKDEVTNCLLTESYSEVGVNFGLLKIEDMSTSSLVESPYSDTKPLEEAWKTMIDKWGNEINSLQMTSGFNKDTKETVNGAQMVHDKTLGLGCSWSASPGGYFFFCFYGPGIKDNALIYQTGPPCTKCPPGLKCTDDSEGLCVKYALYPEPTKNVRPPHIGGGGGGKGKEKQPPKSPQIRSDARSSVFYMGLLMLNAVMAFVFSA